MEKIATHTERTQCGFNNLHIVNYFMPKLKYYQPGYFSIEQLLNNDWQVAVISVMHYPVPRL
jgi:hypothetical protein